MLPYGATAAGFVNSVPCILTPFCQLKTVAGSGLWSR